MHRRAAFTLMALNHRHVAVNYCSYLDFITLRPKTTHNLRTACIVSTSKDVINTMNVYFPVLIQLLGLLGRQKLLII
jgi:hypothetical protein